MVKIIDRIENASTLLIKRIASETNALICSGAPILNLSQGAPNLPLFEPAHAAASAALNSRRLPYTAVAGEESVRHTCAEFVNRNILKRQEGQGGETATFTAKNVCVTNGAVGAVYCTLAIQINSPKDVVVSPLPSYGLYKSDTELLGGTFCPLQCGSPEDGFRITPSVIRGAFETHGENLRVLVLCLPNNPSGSCLIAEEAKLLAAELEYQLIKYPDSFSVLLDEVYTGIAQPDHTSLLCHASEALRKVCFLTISASKGLGGAPGARAGFVACEDDYLVRQCEKVQMATGANISVISQRILEASLSHVLDNEEGVLDSVYMHYREKTDYVCDRLEQMGETYCANAKNKRALCPKRTEGTFYVLACFECLGETDLEVQRVLRDAYKEEHAEYGVAVVPLSAFDVDEILCMVRICCAVDLDLLEKAMDVVEAMMVKAMDKNKTEG